MTTEPSSLGYRSCWFNQVTLSPLCLHSMTFFFRFLASESELELSDDSKWARERKNITRKTLIGFEKHEKGRRCFFVVTKNGDG